MLIEHWGLHWDGPYPYLVEPEGSRCLLEDHDWEGEFTNPRIPCPHRLLPFMKLDAEAPEPNPFLPLPNTGAYSYQDINWTQMPIQVEAWWAKKPAQLARSLQATNITPLCIIGHRWSDLSNIMRFLELPRLRPLIFIGDFTVPGTEFLETQQIFSPAEGLSALRKYVNATTSGSV